MKDKEKQIEEMKDIVHNLWDKLNQDAITTNDIIDALYNEGYCKIEKDSVVLSREEYCELKQAKSLLEIREETIKYLEDANIRYAKALELKVNEKERKETAEKVFREIYKLLISIRKQDHEDSVPYYSENVEEFDDKLYELAKQLGVEIKE